MSPISVLIADDHEIIRYGISTYLSSAEDIKVVGEAATGQECFELYKEKKPDVCLLDIGMPEQNGIETAKKIREIDTDVKILILSMYIDKKMLNNLLEININGYLLKNSDKNDLLLGIRASMKGQQVFSDPISDLIKKLFISQKAGGQEKPKLTGRELEIIPLVVEGLTSKEIAKRLTISPRTVHTHRANLMRKLELSNTAELVRYAIDNDIVSLD